METDIYLYLIHIVPFILLVYLAALMTLHPPLRTVLVPSLLGGLTMALINALVDLVAYNAHWWHYTASGLILHLPLPFYAVQWFIYGGIVYLLIWRFWDSQRHWLALLFLFGAPLFGFALDWFGVVAGSSYLNWDSPLAGPLDFVLWLVMFYGGFLVFRRLARYGEREAKAI